MKHLQILTIQFSKEDFNVQQNEIFVNINDNVEIQQMLNSNNDIIPQIDVKSPTGKIMNFIFETNDKWELLFSSNKCKLRLGYK